MRQPEGTILIGKSNIGNGRQNRGCMGNIRVNERI